MGVCGQCDWDWANLDVLGVERHRGCRMQVRLGGFVLLCFVDENAEGEFVWELGFDVSVIMSGHV
jgi:hypothetical protein